MKPIAYSISILFLLFYGCKSEKDINIDSVYYNAKIWTGLEGNPSMNWIAVSGEKIHSLGTNLDSMPEAKEYIDLDGLFVLPGFNDSHVHFASAGALLLGINLLDVNDEPSFVERIKGATGRIPKGGWIPKSPERM